MGKSYKLVFVTSIEEVNREDDNIDVEVMLEGSKYCATFFTLQNIASLLTEYAKTGECASGTYVWATDMIIVRELTDATVTKAIDDLLATGEFYTCFSKPFPVDVSPSSHEG